MKILKQLSFSTQVTVEQDKNQCHFVTMDGSFSPGCQQQKNLEACASQLVVGKSFISHRSTDPMMNSFILDFDCKLENKLDDDDAQYIMESIVSICVEAFQTLFPRLKDKKHALFLLEHPQEGLQTADGKFAFHLKSIKYPIGISYVSNHKEYQVDIQPFLSRMSESQDDSHVLGSLGGILLTLSDLMYLLQYIKMRMIAMGLEKYTQYLDDQIYKGGLKIRMHNACKYPRCKCKHQKKEDDTYCSSCKKGIQTAETAFRKYKVVRLIDINNQYESHQPLIQALNMNSSQESTLSTTQLNIWMTSPGFITTLDWKSMRSFCGHGPLKAVKNLGSIHYQDLKEQVSDAKGKVTAELRKVIHQNFKPGEKKSTRTKFGTTNSERKDLSIPEHIKGGLLSNIRTRLKSQCMNIGKVTKCVNSKKNLVYFIQLTGQDSHICPNMKRHTHSHASI